MRNRKFWVMVLAVCSLTASAFADVKLATIFTDNMVLQRDKDVPVWGWADEGETVTVSFGGKSVTSTPDASGKWMIKLSPMPANATAQDMTVKGKNEITLKNLLVGDVWVCSGQSNMEYAMSGLQPVTKPDIDSADFPLLRFTTVNKNNQMRPRETCSLAGNSWFASKPGTVTGASATGFYFGRELHKRLNIPVGLVFTSWGGTRIEPWTNPTGFHAVPELKDLAKKTDMWDSTTDVGREAHAKAVAAIKAWIPLAEKAIADKQAVPEMPSVPQPDAGNQEATKLYNGMIHPLLPMAFTGAIWYQGEANGGEGVSYVHKTKALVEGWRQVWNQGPFPFYWVQLANYQNPNPNPGAGDGWARLREAQMQAIKEVPNSGMAVTIDIGEARDIHPKNKSDVGLRLALWALANHYGQKELVFSGPLYRESAVEGNKIRIRFDHAASGLMVGKKEGLKPTEEVAGGEVKQIAIAGEDKKFVWAKAQIEGDSLLVWSDEVTKPVAVRYAFAMNPEGCNLYNKEGLPASPFRTDTW